MGAFVFIHHTHTQKRFVFQNKNKKYSHRTGHSTISSRLAYSRFLRQHKIKNASTAGAHGLLAVARFVFWRVRGVCFCVFFFAGLLLCVLLGRLRRGLLGVPRSVAQLHAGRRARSSCRRMGSARGNWRRIDFPIGYRFDSGDTSSENVDEKALAAHSANRVPEDYK